MLAQALLHGPTPVEQAIARVKMLPDEFGLDRALRAPVDTSLAGLMAMQGRIEEARQLYRDTAATYEEFGLRFRRATQGFVGAQIELLAGNPEGAEQELRASTTAFADFGATTSATTHRALLADVLCTLGRLDEAEAEARFGSAPKRPPTISSPRCSGGAHSPGRSRDAARRTHTSLPGGRSPSARASSSRSCASRPSKPRPRSSRHAAERPRRRLCWTRLVRSWRQRELDRSCTDRCACIDARVTQLSRIASASGEE